jgi:tetratricopeptide (TPR) repeat protein
MRISPLTHKPQAIGCFDRILALNPDHTMALLRRATTLLEQGNTASALEGFNTAVSTAPGESITYYHRAQVRAHVKEEKGTESEMERKQERKRKSVCGSEGWAAVQQCIRGRVPWMRWREIQSACN